MQRDPHCDRVLSIAKLRVGSEAYQLSGVAQSLDDYYTGRGEAEGSWLGAGAERLGLGGAVTAEDLRAVLAGMAPGSGGLTPDGTTVRTHVRRVPGFDLTFKTPKSVSVLYAVSDDPRVQGAILEAGETAVQAAISWLEREAIRVRRGSGDTRYLNDLAARDPAAAEAARQRPVPGRGLVAATFRHRTSRSGDPLLHWHTLVANIVEGADGKWGAFIHPELYRHARAAGELFQAVLRGELTERLGLEWRPGAHVPEVAGVPQAICTLFSKRSAEIDAWLAATGTPDDAAGRQEAVLATRRGKPELEGERFDAAWKMEAADAGWGPDAAEALVASCGDRAVPEIAEVWRIPTVDQQSGNVVDRVVDAEEWIGTVSRALTESDSTFIRPDVVRAVAARIGEGATPATIERVVARVLASEQVVPVADERVARWTTTELLDVEARFLATARSTRGTRTPIVGVRLEEVLAGARLGPDQETAVRTIAGSTDAVSVMVGPAGTGKTYTLDVVRQVFEAVGQRVVGVAPSARAAQEMQEDAAIASSTIHRLLGSWDRGYELPTRATLLVVDEAGMAGIRDLERVVRPVVAAGGRVLLVGDHHQLPEVAAGGGFAALATDREATVAELTVNRRQQQAWEIDALAELRNGHVAKAVAAYGDHGRVVVTDDRATLVQAGVERWMAAHRAGTVPVLLAGTNEMVDALNDAVRRQLLDLRVLGPVIDDTASSLAIGERLMIRVNDYQATTTDRQTTAVLNGQPCTLTAVAPDGYTIRMDHDGSEVLLNDEFVRGGGVGYAYASTAHKAQGGTWDLAITVGLDGLYREAGYLVMSRGQASNWLIVTQPEMDDIDADLARHGNGIPLPGEEPDTVDEELLDRLNMSRAKLLAHTRDPHAPAIQHAATTVDLASLEDWADHARTVEAEATRLVGIDPQRQRALLERIEYTARHAQLGQRIKAWDRRNIGTITGLLDEIGRLQVTFVASDGRTATKTMGWGDVTILEPRQPAPRTLTAVAASRLDALTAGLRERLERWEAHLVQRGVKPGDRHLYDSAIALATDRAARRLTADQPDWLTTLIGPRPLNRPAATQVWDDAVRDLATHRLRHDITNPATPTGPNLDDERRAAVWTDAAPAITRARLWLDTHTDGPAISIVRTRSQRELRQRRHELDAILASAPPDMRRLIDRLRNSELLLAADTTELLQQALATQGERRNWILEHWPHVIEATEIDHTLRDRAALADPSPLLDALLHSDDPLLAAAAATRERWLVTLATQLVADDATTVEPNIERLLSDVAHYRRRWSVDGPDPLGAAATDPDQADEYILLALAIDQAFDTGGQPTPQLGTAVDDPAIRSLLDDLPGW